MAAMQKPRVVVAFDGLIAEKLQQRALDDGVTVRACAEALLKRPLGLLDAPLRPEKVVEPCQRCLHAKQSHWSTAKMSSQRCLAGCNCARYVAWGGSLS